MVYYVTRCADRSDELYHHGVKGMKWGVRRAKTAVSTASKSIQAARYEESLNKAKRRQRKATARYERRNARYQRKIDKLDTLYNTKVSDLSQETIKRGRVAYTAIKMVRNKAITMAIGAAGGQAIVTAINGVNLANVGVAAVNKILLHNPPARYA